MLANPSKRAMKSMRESLQFSEVKHWAPFVLIGDDVTLDFGGGDDLHGRQIFL